MTVWLNAEQIADRLSVSRKTALMLMQQMPHSVISGTVRKRIRVSEGSFESWMVKRSSTVPVIKTVSTGSRKKLKRR